MDQVRRLGRYSGEIDESVFRRSLNNNSSYVSMRNIEQTHAVSNVSDVMGSRSFGEMFGKLGNIWKTGFSRENADRYILRSK